MLKYLGGKHLNNFPFVSSWTTSPSAFPRRTDRVTISVFVMAFSITYHVPPGSTDYKHVLFLFQIGEVYLVRSWVDYGINPEAAVYLDLLLELLFG